jgi:hypothetical protein
MLNRLGGNFSIHTKKGIFFPTPINVIKLQPFAVSAFFFPVTL